MTFTFSTADVDDLIVGLNSNNQRNCCKIWDEVEGALAGDWLAAIDGIDADDERALLP